MTKLSLSDAKEALRIALIDLKNIGIEDDIVIKIKDFQKKKIDAVGIYRSFTQFRSKPTFWLDENFPTVSANISKEVWEDDCEDQRIESEYWRGLIDTCFHLYGRVIAECLRMQDNEGYALIVDNFTNEDEFAEDFIAYVQYQLDDRYNPIIQRYKALIA